MYGEMCICAALMALDEEMKKGKRGRRGRRRGGDVGGRHAWRSGVREEGAVIGGAASAREIRDRALADSILVVPRHRQATMRNDLRPLTL